MDRVYESRTK
ncbi:unnamed protein product, partial [Didymodactylos carnosus]